MASYYVPLPAYRVPGPIDFSGLNEGLDAIKKETERNRLMQIGSALQSGDQPVPTGEAPQTTSNLNPLLKATAGGDMSRYASSISNIESGGNYGELGPVTRSGDRAYGRYQIMGANVGPWTREALGREMSPQEFLNNKEAQDAVFNAKFGQYVQKYGPDGASRAWFAGEGGMNDPNRRDQLGTSVASYAAKFNAGMGQPANPLAPTPAAPVTSTAPQGGLNYGAGVREALRQGNIPFAQSLMQQQRADEAAGRQGQMFPYQIQEAQAGAEKTRVELENLANQRLGVIANTIQGAAPDAQAAMWQKVLQSHPNMVQALTDHGVDPANVKQGTDFFINQARGLQLTTETGVVPQYYTDQQGNLRAYVVTKKGERKDISLPGTPAVGVEVRSTGTELVPLNKRTGQEQGTRIPIQNAEKAAEEARGKGAGEAQLMVPGVENLVGNANDVINVVRSHPGLKAATGLQGVLDPRNYTPGTDAWNFAVMNKTAMAQAFMSAREGLKGAGQVTDFEGTKGEQAIANLTQTQGTPQYLQNLDRLQKMMNASLESLRKKAAMGKTGDTTPESGVVRWERGPDGLPRRVQ